MVLLSIMIIFALTVLGLCLGSFVNALVWRVYMQDRRTSKRSKDLVLPPAEDLSIIKGRSMCPHCRHDLGIRDLVPVLSWLVLRGRCRYCRQPIGWQYPAVELSTAALFLVSYMFWPLAWDAAGIVNFAVWLVMLAGFMALLVYDFRWMLLPNRIIYPLIGLAVLLAGYNVLVAGELGAAVRTLLGVAIAGGLFYGLFMVSDGRWIGGGDVKLGLLIGLLLADPYKAFLMLMVASLLGTLIVLPGLLLRKVKGNSRIPFGPFLIMAAIIVMLFGDAVIDWYKQSLLLDM